MKPRLQEKRKYRHDKNITGKEPGQQLTPVSLFI